tara:strand:- start:1950 stop:2429 length:480 start_codon:yes stop_codon:yes gene_type:complete
MKKAWIVINNFKFFDFKKYGIKKLNNKKYKISPWIENIILRKKFNLRKHKLPIKLVRVKVKDLNFKKPTKLKRIYKKAKDNGYHLVSPDVAIYSRLLYKNQKNGEWLRFATPMNSMIDSDGVPHLPKLGKALGYYFVETYWSYPKAIFHPHNEFVFRIK